MARVLVIGAANTDIVGVPEARSLRAHDSNPGHVTVSAGGVGRNVAENLARLGADVVFVSAFGDDANGQARSAECASAGIDVSRAVLTPGAPGPVYLAVLDEAGDLAVAVNDMRALECMGPDEVERALAGLARPDALVLDANLGAPALGRARDLMAGVPLFLECVSAAKAPRLGGLLEGATAVHANVLEAVALTGGRFEQSLDGARHGAEALVELGVTAAYVTAGAHGIAYAARGGPAGVLPAPHARVVNATGAGDAFMAGVVAGTLAGKGADAVARVASACAAITLGDESTVAAGLGREAVEQETGESL